MTMLLQVEDNLEICIVENTLFTPRPCSTVCEAWRASTQEGWNDWRRMPDVICDRRVPARVKGKVYKVAVRPAMLYVLEMVALTKKQEAEMEVAELKTSAIPSIIIKMLRFSLGVTIMDKIRNEYIRGTGQRRWDGLERKMRDTTDEVWTCRAYGGNMMGILGEGC